MSQFGQNNTLKGVVKLAGRKQKEYALYKGEELLMFGTILELAAHYNVLPETIKYYGMPTYLRRIEKRNGKLGGSKVLVRLD